MSNEEWRPIVGFEGRYEISDHGNVRSLDRYETLSNGHRRFHRGGPKAATLNPTGYRYVHLRRDAQGCKRFVHALVLEAFVGPRPAPGMHGCHNDGNPLNNHVANLRWDTPKGNVADKRIHGTNHELNKSQCPYGHRYEGDNIVWTTKGHRQCRACANRHRIERRGRVKAAVTEGRTWCEERGVDYAAVRRRFELAHGCAISLVRDDEKLIRDFFAQLREEAAMDDAREKAAS